MWDLDLTTTSSSCARINRLMLLGADWLLRKSRARIITPPLKRPSHFNRETGVAQTSTQQSELWCHVVFCDQQRATDSFFLFLNFFLFLLNLMLHIWISGLQARRTKVQSNGSDSAVLKPHERNSHGEFARSCRNNWADRSKSVVEVLSGWGILIYYIIQCIWSLLKWDVSSR